MLDRHCTHCWLLVLQRGVAPPHCALLVQPAVHSCVCELHVWLFGQLVFERHCTHVHVDVSHSGARCGQFASPRHCTQPPNDALQWGAPGGHWESLVHAVVHWPEPGLQVGAAAGHCVLDVQPPPFVPEPSAPASVDVVMDELLPPHPTMMTTPAATVAKKGLMKAR